MHTPAPVQLESSDILQGLVNNKGQFDPMQILREGPEATPQQILDMAMDNRAEHFDLIGACVDLLRAQGVKQEKIDIMLNDGLIAAAIGRSAYAQRQALNTFWTLQMSAFGVNAMKHRARLITHGTAADWIRFFNDGPASFIAEFDLPM